MEKKSIKKIFLIAGIVVDVAVTLFLLVVSIIMLAETIGKTTPEIIANEGFIGYLQNHPTFYGLVFVVPLFVLLAINVIGLVIYVKKTSATPQVQVGDLSDDQKAALREQLLKELQGGAAPQEEKKEEPKEE